MLPHQPLSGAETPNTEEGPSAQVEEYVTALTAESKEDRRTASYRLSQMGPEAQPAVPALIKALEDRDEQVWFNAVTALARIGPGAKEAVPALMRELEGANRGRYRLRGQYRVAFALGSIGSAAIPALREGMRHEREHVRAGAAKAVTWIQPAPEELADDLVVCLGDQEEDVRANAAEALGKMGDACWPALLALLQNPEASQEAKVAATQAIGRWQSLGDDSRQSLWKLYREEKEARVRGALVTAISQWAVDRNRLLDLLLEGLDDSEEAVRDASMNALILMEPPGDTSVPALIPWLEQEDQDRQRRAAMVLGFIGPDAAAAVPHLEKALRQAELEDQTRQALEESLERIRLKAGNEPDNG